MRWLVLMLVACAAMTPTDRAQSLMRQHKEEEAIAVLRKDLAEHPDDIAARKLLVRIHAFKGDLGAAREEIGEIAKRVPDGDPTPWIELGHAYELVHKFEEALAAYDEAADRAPQSPLGPREGGMRSARWGETDEALPRLEEAVKRGAHDSETFHVLGLVRLKKGDFDGATAAYKKGLEADPESAENLLGLASVAVKKQDYAAALAAYDALLVKHPKFAAAMLGRAYSLGQLGRKKEALAALERAKELGASQEYIDKQRAALDAH